MRKIRIKKKFWRRTLRVLGVFILLITAGIIYLVVVSKPHPPTIANTSSLQLQRVNEGNGVYSINNNWFKKSNSGLYEMYVEGGAFERGVINGKLSQELVIRQEDHFVDQIKKMIPSQSYLKFLRYFIGWFNRHLEQNVTEEYKEEILGVSESASPNYDFIGTNYQRILNYHAAHDIGHALQTMALVGCTSFGTWGGRSQDSTMIIGRNFDFYVGDKFAEDKIVLFVNPEQGYKFMSVTWGGFVGVVSGMNEQGLTITINAAKTSMPTASATPVSLVAREILQYAKNISEAVQIAKKRRMFVSESLLVGSANDGKAVVIEKTPDAVDVYDPGKDMIVCANHFQSNGLGKSAENIEQLNESASPYRYKRLMELLDKNGVNTVQKTVNILRDRQGINNTDIGMGNEKALNQLIAHHSIVFEPKKLLVWVSTSPWQLGEYVAYDLRKVFAMKGLHQNIEITDSSLAIAPDSFLNTPAYKNFIAYRNFKQRIADGGDINVDSLITSNPQLYNTYVLAGDYLFKKKNYAAAKKQFEMALTKEIATTGEADHVKKQIAACNKKLAQ